MGAAKATELALGDLLVPGDRVLLGDGIGVPAPALPGLYSAAARVGGIRLLLGWTLAWPGTFDRHPFAEIRTLLAAPATARAVTKGEVKAPAVRLAAVPSLIRSRLRPDVVLVSARRCAGRLMSGSQVSWLPAAAETGARIVTVVNDHVPAMGTDLHEICDPVVIEGEPTSLGVGPSREASDDEAVIAARVAALIPEGSTVQIGAGSFARPLVEAVEAPIRLLSGVVTDTARVLDQRGMLLSRARGAYLAGGPEVLAWAEQRVDLERLESIFAPPQCDRFIAVNTALEIDRSGQVNVERVGSRTLAGAGGHPDFCAMAANHPAGVSIIAVPTTRAGRSTLVNQLSAGTSTLRSDVHVVVTERGHVDLRGLDDNERDAALTQLWGTEGSV